MANLVNLDRVGKAYPAMTLLEGVSLGLDDADRVGVVGLNGAGKTTLLRMLTKADEPDSGRVTHRRDLRVLSLPQTLDLPPETTVGDVVVGGAWLPPQFDAEHEWASDAGIRGVLDGLGAHNLGLDTRVGPLSGGERRRVALAALLVRPSDLLILDEPTNHLDVVGVDWLAGYLLNRKGALVVVTHDRWFLDAVCTTTWEVADGTVYAYDGGYAAWTLARAERQRRADVAESRRQNLLRKEIAWLRRGPPARTSKPRFRIEAANALIADVPPVRDSVSLRRLATARLGKQVYELESVTLQTPGPEPRVLLDGLTWHVGPGDRVAIVGANGSGKTTLLRALAGQRDVDGGKLSAGKTVRPAYLSQELHDLPGHLRLLEAVEEVAKRVQLGGKEMSAAQLAEVFGFTGPRTWTPVAELSGGERRRLQLLRLLAAEPNVLILDEPTNDLDIDTLAALEDLLDTWPGTLIVASHDRYLVERVCDTTMAFVGDGRLVDLPGGIDEFLAMGAGVGGRTAATSQTNGQAATLPSASAAADLRLARKEMARLERQIGKLEQREAALHVQLAEHASDYERVSELDAQLRTVVAERSAAEEEWLTLADRVPSD